MSFLRSTALRASSLARAARPARYIRAAELQPWQRAVQRRMYASEHGAHGETKGSEVPWIAAAVAGTVGGLYFTVTQDLGHGSGHDDHHAEAHETHGKDEGEDEDAADKSGSQGGPKDEVKSKSSDEPKEEKEKSGEDSESKADENDKASPDKSDKPDARGKAKSSNETSGKQEGLSNTDTHHSTDVSNSDDKSKKGEGVAETAKVKGTVSTERPPAENKEERGKAQVDKDA